MWSLPSVRWICGYNNFDICCFRAVAFTAKRNWFQLMLIWIMWPLCIYFTVLCSVTWPASVFSMWCDDVMMSLFDVVRATRQTPQKLGDYADVACISCFSIDEGAAAAAGRRWTALTPLMSSLVVSARNVPYVCRGCGSWHEGTTASCKKWRQSAMHALRPNSITLSWSLTGPKLVAHLQLAGIWPITSSELARASKSATGLRPASDLSATRTA